MKKIQDNHKKSDVIYTFNHSTMKYECIENSEITYINFDEKFKKDFINLLIIKKIIEAKINAYLNEDLSKPYEPYKKSIEGSKDNFNKKNVIKNQTNLLKENLKNKGEPPF
jgi:hypothetical protein